MADTATPEPSYADQAMQAFATVQDGLPRGVLTLLATSGQMRTATELQGKLGTTQSEVIRCLKWLEQWGLVTSIPQFSDSVYVVRWSLTNSGAMVQELLPTLAQ
jgi:DNA-binding IclR family transcriptional regulator